MSVVQKNRTPTEGEREKRRGKKENEGRREGEEGGYKGGYKGGLGARVAVVASATEAGWAERKKKKH